MKSLRLVSLHRPTSGHWHIRTWRLAHAARTSARAKRTVEPEDGSFGDSLHPVLAIANRIAVFFLAMSAVAFPALVTDAFLTRT